MSEPNNNFKDIIGRNLIRASLVKFCSLLGAVWSRIFIEATCATPPDVGEICTNNGVYR